MESRQPTTDPGLPAWATTFVGREAEIQHVVTMLSRPDRRLVTLFGPGGVGKTRLACEVIAQLAEEMPATFVAAAHATQLDAVLAACILPFEEPRGAAVETLNAFFGDDSYLLVVDNLEHLVDQVMVLSELVARCPNLRILATSRAVLGLPGEWVVPVRGLQFPNSATSTAATAFDGVRLVVDRVEQASGRAFDDSQLPAAVQLCELTEGLPLAIELAASWSATLGLQDIVTELRSGSAVLTARGHQPTDRHRSMRAVVEQSWKLLSPGAQAILRRVAGFPSSFTREACMDVTGAGIDAIAELVEKSLLQRDEDMRFRLHPLVLEYANEMLRSDPGDASGVEARHARYYLGRLGAVHAELRGPRHAAAVEELRADWNNIRAAWSYARNAGDIEALAEALNTLHVYCALAGHHETAIDLAAGALSAADCAEGPATLLRFRAYSVIAWARQELGHLDEAEQAAVDADSLVATLPRGTPMNVDPVALRGLIARTRGDFASARGFGEQAVHRAREAGDPWLESYALYLLGNVQMALGDAAGAAQHFRRAFGLSQGAGDRWFLAFLHNDLGRIALSDGSLDEATAHFAESLRIREETGNASRIAVAEQRLAEVLEARGQLREAEERQRRSMQLYRKAGDRGSMVRASAALAHLAVKTQPPAAAMARLVEALRPALDLGMMPVVIDLLREVAELEGAQHPRSNDVLRLLVLVSGDERARESTRRAAQRAIESAGHQPHMLTDARRWAKSTTAESVAAALVAPQMVPQAVSAPAIPGLVPTGEWPALTARETDVLTLIARGLSNEQIGIELGMKLGTVKWYSSQIFSKLGVTNRTHATAKARELGMLG